MSHFWSHVDGAPSACRAADPFGCDCWAHTRTVWCLALNTYGERCGRHAGDDFPFCGHHHESAIEAMIGAALGKQPWRTEPIDRFELQLDNWYGGKLPERHRRRLRAIAADPEVHAGSPSRSRLLPCRTAVYRHFDEEARLLYVGISSDPETRGRQHARDSGWYRFLAHTDVKWFGTRIEAEWAEREAIHSESPLFNKAGSSADRNRRVAEYLLDTESYDLLKPAI